MGSNDSRTHRRRLLVLLGVVLAVLAALGLTLASCRDDGGGADDPATSTTEPDDGTAIDATPADPADQVVWQERTIGAEAAEAEAAAAVPAVTIYADGRIFRAVRDPSSRADHPVPVVAGQIDDEALADFLDAVSASGLFEDDVDFGAPDLPELSRTTVLTHLGGEVRLVDVYALEPSFEEVLSGDEVDRRNTLRNLLSSAAALADDARPWTPDRIRVTDLGAPDTEAEPGTVPPLAWTGPDFTTFAEVPGSDERCLELDGEEAADVFAAAVANPGIAFAAGTEVRQLAVAALLPEEPGCET